MLKQFFIFLVLMVSGTEASLAATSCVTVTKYPVISFSGAVQVSPSAAIGSAIATGQTLTTLNSNLQGGSITYFLFAGTPVSGVTYSVNGAAVFPTNLAGVGISVWADNNIPKSTALSISKPDGVGYVTMNYNIYYALVKTANVTSSGTVNSVVFNQLINDCLVSGMLDNYAINIAVTGAPTVSIKACTVDNPAINVPLGTTKNTAFTGIGSTANTQTFTVSLTCSQAASAKITLSPGSSGAFNAASGVINLDPSTTGTVATGVGIQLLYNNAAAPLNSAISVGSLTAAGNLTVPLSARYYQTATKVTGGVANGTATFTMTYN
ncbi:fimbrial protein [Enterobacter sp. 186315]